MTYEDMTKDELVQICITQAEQLIHYANMTLELRKLLAKYDSGTMQSFLIDVQRDLEQTKERNKRMSNDIQEYRAHVEFAERKNERLIRLVSMLSKHVKFKKISKDRKQEIVDVMKEYGL